MNQIGCDVLETRAGRWLLRRPWFPLTLQVLALAAFVVLAAAGWGVGEDVPGDRLLTLRKTNLATLVVWGLWWPVMIALALGLGRLWCAACPMELVSRAGDGAASRLGCRRFRLPGWMRAGWAVVGAYLLLQLIVAGFSIHRVPHYTSIMLIVLGTLSLASGLFFAEPRAFCKALCPAAKLLSVYGRYTPLQLDVRDPEVCAACTSKDCVRAENRFHFDRRSCPSLLRPFARAPSDGCVLCLQCAKVCPSGNVGFGLADPPAGSRRRRPLLPAEAAFVTLAAGFVTHEVVGEVGWLDERFHAAPRLLAELVPGLAFGWAEALWFLALFPALLWATAGGLGLLLGYRGKIGTLVISAATAAAPLVATAHLAKALAKIASWAGYLPLALRDPSGIGTLEALAAKRMPPPAAIAALSTVGAIMALALAVMGWKAWRWAREATPAELPAARAGFAVTATLFTAVLAIWIGG